MTSPTTVHGLSSAAAAQRLAADGPNELPQNRPRRWRDLLREAAREPMFRLLVAAAALYLLLGEPNEGLFLLAMVLVVFGLTLYQERKTCHALERLRELSSPTALVLRDGRRRQIDSRQLVAGDVLVLDEGNHVPADAELLTCNGLQVDESLLTGESCAVQKQAAAGAGADADSGRVFAASPVVAGHALARVTATGRHTAVGRIGAALLVLDPARSPMQAQVQRLTVRFAWYGMALSALLVLVFGIARGDWLQALLAGIALAMSMLPEEFPVVLTVFPALGAWRLARANVLTRRLDAIETLGSISVLCVDKTGTLTENRMAVASLHADDQLLELADCAAIDWPAPHRAVAEWAVLASAAVPVDPMEQAIAALAPQVQQRPGWQAVRGYGLAPGLPMMSRVWQAPAQAGYLVAAKGAPEAVLPLCSLAPELAARLARQTAAMASQGLRLLAVAWAHADGDNWPASQTGFRYRYAGLVALADPLRAEIPAAIAECRRAGVRVLMVTGDHPATAAAIARQAGLQAEQGSLLTGAQIGQMDDARLHTALRTASVCARITPEQKLRIVDTLRAGGEVVAMTGDGVNDAPALKAAHVGIAMGLRGTDVARAAAALVLLDDRFASIVQAIRGGRRIYDNIRKAVAYIIATHVPIAGMAMLPVLLGLPPVLYPMHIVFLELIIDPACSLAFENEQEEGDLMARPPRPASQPLLSWSEALVSLAQGGCALALAVAAYAWAVARLPADEARALAFAMLVSGNLLLIVANRSRQRRLLAALRAPNAIAWGVIGAALALLTLCLYQPGLAALFRFAPLSWAALAALAGSSALTLLCLEVLKRWRPTS